MPLQKGLYRIKGKHNGLAYYSVKSGVGDVFRRINEQMSERVKTEPEFANTRKYAEEFGVCVSTANAIFYGVSKRTISGTLTRLKKEVFSAMRNQSNPNVGARDFSDNGWQDSVCNLLNNSTRVDCSDFGKSLQNITVERNPSSQRYNAHILFRFSYSADIGKYYQDLGYDRASITFYVLSMTTPIYDSTIGKHSKLISQISTIGTATMHLGIAGGSGAIQNTFYMPHYGQEDGKYFHRLLMYISPYKSSNPDYVPSSLESVLLVPLETIVE